MRSTGAVMLATLALLAACQTTTSDQWSGGETTPFPQAERSCEEQTAAIREEGDRREFFIGCMGALGWVPRDPASVDAPGQD